MALRHRQCWPRPLRPEDDGRSRVLPRERAELRLRRTRTHFPRELIFPPASARPRGHDALRHLRSRTRGCRAGLATAGLPAPRTALARARAGAAAPELEPRDPERERPRGAARTDSEEETERAAAPRPHLPPEDLDALQGALGRHDCSYKREGDGVSADRGRGRQQGAGGRSPPSTHPPVSGGTGKRPNGASQPLLRGSRAAKRNAVFRQCDTAPVRALRQPGGGRAGASFPLIAVLRAGGSARRLREGERAGRPAGPPAPGEARRRGRASVSPAPSGGAVSAASPLAGRRGPRALRPAGRPGRLDRRWEGLNGVDRTFCKAWSWGTLYPHGHPLSCPPSSVLLRDFCCGFVGVF